MKRLVFALPFLAAFLQFSAIAPAAPAETTPAADYSRFASITSIACDFRMERHLLIADKPLVSTGHFIFRRPDFLRWEYRAPLVHGLLINGKSAFSWRDEEGRRAVKDISRQPFARLMAEQLRLFISLDMAQIGKKYRVEPFRENGGEGVDLHPLDTASPRQTIAKIRLYLDPKRPVATQTVIQEKSGEKTVITYSAHRIDQPLPPGADQP